MRRSTIIRQRYAGILQPAWDRLADAYLIKRHPVTDEITWPNTCLEDDLRKAGLI
jgi:hypothetical protein